MEIKLTPQARIQLELMAETRVIETGFLFGLDIGKYRIIENLTPVNFNETTIDEVYAGVYDKIGNKLVGVFFNNREPFPSDWFIEDTVIKIKTPGYEFYLYSADGKYTRLRQVTF